MLQLITAPLEATKEMYDVLVVGGVFGVGIWSPEIDAYTMWERAIGTLEPGLKCPPPFGNDNTRRTPAELDEVLKTVRLGDIKVEIMKMPFVFKSAIAHADLWFEAANPGATKVQKFWHVDRTWARKARGDGGKKTVRR